MRFVPLAITLFLLLGILADNWSHPTRADAAPFHATARRLISAIPHTIGDWTGADEQIPPAATGLLRPNALLSRAFRNRGTGLEATLVIIQCRDTRDMGAHYPPICYPAAGWEKTLDPQLDTLDVNGLTLQVARYGFRQPGFGRRQELSIVGFFAMPGRGSFAAYESIGRATTDHRARPFGAAQVQLLFDATVPRYEQDQAARVLLAEILPVIQHLGGPTDSRAGDKP
jgi:hypothetical protein